MRIKWTVTGMYFLGKTVILFLNVIIIKFVYFGVLEFLFGNLLI